MATVNIQTNVTNQQNRNIAVQSLNVQLFLQLINAAEAVTTGSNWLTNYTLMTNSGLK